MAPRTDLEDIRKAHLARIEDIAICRRNGDTIDAENAARNLMTGKAAYWSMHRGAGVSVTLASAANRDGSLLSAMIDLAERSRHMHLGLITEALDAMIPLNQLAIEELGLCYRLQSTFRDDLGDRERKAIHEPYWLLYPYIEEGKVWEFWDRDYRAAQRRFDERQRDAHWHTPVSLEVAVA